MHFIALMVPQGTTQILPAVKDTKTADAENDSATHNSKKSKRKSSVNCFY